MNVVNSGSNTLVTYQYCDGGGSKLGGFAIVRGTASGLRDLLTIRRSLEDGEFFNAQQVGLSDCSFIGRGHPPNDLDHSLIRLLDFKDTDWDPTVSITLAELVENFRVAGLTGWNFEDPYVPNEDEIGGIRVMDAILDEDEDLLQEAEIFAAATLNQGEKVQRTFYVSRSEVRSAVLQIKRESDPHTAPFPDAWGEQYTQAGWAAAARAWRERGLTVVDPPAQREL